MFHSFHLQYNSVPVMLCFLPREYVLYLWVVKQTTTTTTTTRHCVYPPNIMNHILLVVLFSLSCPFVLLWYVLSYTSCVCVPYNTTHPKNSYIHPYFHLSIKCVHRKGRSHISPKLTHSLIPFLPSFDFLPSYMFIFSHSTATSLEFKRSF